MPNDNIPFSCKQPTSTLTNAQFLAALTARVPERIDGQIPYLWVTAFPGDPNTDGDWRGRPVFRPLDKYLPPTDNELNTFYTVSAFVPGKDGRVSRAKQCFGGLFVLVIDDLGDGLGGKVPWSRVAGHLSPSYILETSVGSYQMGYILAEPVTDRVRAESLIDAMTYQGIGATEDPGMLGVTRNVRLAVGINGKLKYREQAHGFLPPLPIEQAPRHRLVHWDPDAVYSAEQLIWDYGLDLSRASVGAGASFRGTPGVMPDEDPWYRVWNAAGLLKGDVVDKGAAGNWVEVTCPNLTEHTDQADNGSAYCLGRGQAGGYRCHHGHCDDLDWPAVRARFLAGDFGDDVRQLAADAYAQELFGAEGIAAVDAHLAQVRAEHTRNSQSNQSLPHGTARPPAARGPVSPEAVRAWAMGAFPERDHRDLADTATIQQLARTVAASNPEMPKSDRDALWELACDRTKQSITVLRDAYATARKAQQRAWDEEDAARAAQEAMLEAQHGPRLDSQGFPRRPYIRDNEWVSTDGNDPVCDASNIALMLTRAGTSIRHNEMTMQDEVHGDLSMHTVEVLINIVTSWCMQYKLKGTLHATVRRALNTIAAQNHYHPFHDFLEDVRDTWDGQERLKQLIELLPVAPGDEYIRETILRRWLFSVIGAARWMYRGIPGAHPRGVMVLRGPQYSGKTSFLQKLFTGLYEGSDACFISGRHYDGTTDSKLELLGKLVAELGEIDATTNRAESGMLKAFLSGEADRLRRPYAVAHEEITRRTVFAGSVNVSYLKDPSGNTRFWSLELTEKIDLDKVSAIDMRQLWAEIDHKCREAWAHRGNGSGCFTPWHMRDDEMKEIEKRNESHRIISPAEQWLVDSFEWEDERWRELMDAYNKTGDKEIMKQLLSINAMTVTQIMDMSNRSGGNRSTEAYLGPLRRLTGLAKPIHRSVWLKDPATGKGRSSSSRVWPLPPLRAASVGFGAFMGTEEEQTEGRPARVH